MIRFLRRYAGLVIIVIMRVFKGFDSLVLTVLALGGISIEAQRTPTLFSVYIYHLYSTAGCLRSINEMPLPWYISGLFITLLAMPDIHREIDYDWHFSEKPSLNLKPPSIRESGYCMKCIYIFSHPVWTSIAMFIYCGKCWTTAAYRYCVYVWVDHNTYNKIIDVNHLSCF